MDRETLEAKRQEYTKELQNAEMTMLRLQGAIAAVNELLDLAAKDARPTESGGTK